MNSEAQVKGADAPDAKWRTVVAGVLAAFLYFSAYYNGARSDLPPMFEAFITTVLLTVVALVFVGLIAGVNAIRQRPYRTPRRDWLSLVVFLAAMLLLGESRHMAPSSATVSHQSASPAWTAPAIQHAPAPQPSAPAPAAPIAPDTSAWDAEVVRFLAVPAHADIAGDLNKLTALQGFVNLIGQREPNLSDSALLMRALERLRHWEAAERRGERDGARWLALARFAAGAGNQPLIEDGGQYLWWWITYVEREHPGLDDQNIVNTAAMYARERMAGER